ncbi:MAG: potassium channel protein [Planctomycetota bacterium]
MALLHQLRQGLLFLAVFAALSVGGHMWVTGEGVLDSFYFFVVTVSTVGYGEKSDAPPALKLLNIGTIVVGAVAAGYTLNLVAKSIIEGQVRQALGIQRMTREIQQLSGHTIICGFGRIGETLAGEFLRRGTEFVIIDQNPEVVTEACDENLLVVAGDATEEETLIDAGIKRATTLVVAMQGDADNVFLTLTARNLNPRLKIIARGEQAATEKKLRQAGADQVVLPAVIGARRMAALVTRPAAAEMLEHFTDHDKLDADLEEICVHPDSGLIGKTIRETAARQSHNLLVIGIRTADGQIQFNPDPDQALHTGDTLIAMGRRADIQDFRSTYVIKQ